LWLLQVGEDVLIGRQLLNLTGLRQLIGNIFARFNSSQLNEGIARIDKRFGQQIGGLGVTLRRNEKS
jgi:hypothetical protein